MQVLEMLIFEWNLSYVSVSLFCLGYPMSKYVWYVTHLIVCVPLVWKVAFKNSNQVFAQLWFSSVIQLKTLGSWMSITVSSIRASHSESQHGAYSPDIFWKSYPDTWELEHSFIFMFFLFFWPSFFLVYEKELHVCLHHHQIFCYRSSRKEF